MRRLLPLLVATVLLSGCKSDAEKLVDLRTELRATIDALYASYRGDEGAGAGDEAEPSERGDDARAFAARLVGELDRSHFEAVCLARGRGERPFSFSGQLDAFLKDPANEKACRTAARLAARIEALEANAER